jgi:hypothetical protein
MDTSTKPRPFTRCVVVLAIASGALGLTACQTVAQSPQPHHISPPRHGPVDARIIEEYAGRPADRVAEELQRRVDAGQLPSSACLQHSLVEHPDGGYHLVCAVPAPRK